MTQEDVKCCGDIDNSSIRFGVFKKNFAYFRFSCAPEKIKKTRCQRLKILTERLQR